MREASNCTFRVCPRVQPSSGDCPVFCPAGGDVFFFISWPVEKLAGLEDGPALY